MPTDWIHNLFTHELRLYQASETGEHLYSPRNQSYFPFVVDMDLKKMKDCVVYSRRLTHSLKLEIFEHECAVGSMVL